MKGANGLGPWVATGWCRRDEGDEGHTNGPILLLFLCVAADLGYNRFRVFYVIWVCVWGDNM